MSQSSNLLRFFLINISLKMLKLYKNKNDFFSLRNIVMIIVIDGFYFVLVRAKLFFKSVVQLNMKVRKKML